MKFTNNVSRAPSREWQQQLIVSSVKRACNTKQVPLSSWSGMIVFTNFVCTVVCSQPVESDNWTGQHGRRDTANSGLPQRFTASLPGALASRSVARVLRCRLSILSTAPSNNTLSSITQRHLSWFSWRHLHYYYARSFPRHDRHYCLSKESLTLLLPVRPSHIFKGIPFWHGL